MTRVVSLERIENAFDEAVRSIDELENILNSHIDIEINEMKLAQLEKINFLNKRLDRVNYKIVNNNSYYQVAISR